LWLNGGECPFNSFAHLAIVAMAMRSHLPLIMHYKELSV
jgi:hypothetical protein